MQTDIFESRNNFYGKIRKQKLLDILKIASMKRKDCVMQLTRVF